MTLTDFLAERVAEDEAMLRTPGLTSPGGEYALEVWDNGETVGLSIPEGRLAAECAAKRWMLGEHRNDGGECETCAFDLGAAEGGPSRLARSMYPCATVRFMAEAYSNHPDFDPRWSPTS